MIHKTLHRKLTIGQHYRQIKKKGGVNSYAVTITWRISLEEQEWFTLLGHLRPPPVFNGVVCCPIFCFLFSVLVTVVCIFVLYLFSYCIACPSSIYDFWLKSMIINIILSGLNDLQWFIHNDFEPTIYHTQGKQANQYSTDAVLFSLCYWSDSLSISNLV